MVISIGIALLVCIVGLVVYLVSAHAKAMEIGRIMFAFGLLVVLWLGPTVLGLHH